MIEKILDNYFAKKCIEEIEHNIVIWYNLDFKVEKTDNKYFIDVKKKKYKDYTNIGIIFNSKATLTFIYFEDYWEHLKEKIGNYLGDKE